MLRGLGRLHVFPGNDAGRAQQARAGATRSSAGDPTRGSPTSTSSCNSLVEAGLYNNGPKGQSRRRPTDVRRA